MHTSPRYERATRTTRPATVTRRGSRRLAAELLRAASSLLDRYAAALAAAEARAAEREARAVREGLEALLEFHAEAGAPEGALYVDGVLVAYLPGVNRL